jgi:hypothetical protein
LKRPQVTGGWRKLYIEELCDLKLLLEDIIRTNKSRRIRLAGNEAHMEEK